VSAISIDLCSALLATTAAQSLGTQNACAICSHRSVLPNDGPVVGRNPQVLIATNWSHNIFTAPSGLVFVPDNSVNNVNDSAQPLIRTYGV
jgi:hypothetical protein